MIEYECDCCGACCRRVLVELAPADLEREPRLVPLARQATYKVVPTVGGAEVGPPVETRRTLAMAADGPGGACRFQAADSRCTIHPTRPDACRLVPAGGPHCQDERRKAGLPPLAPHVPTPHGPTPV